MNKKPTAQITVFIVVLFKNKKQNFSFHQHNSTREKKGILNRSCP